VFDRFRQADPSTTRRHGGLGIGLSLVKNLVELHGGSVRVSSPGENRGTTFIITLPIAAVHHDDTGVFLSRETPAELLSLDRVDLPRLDGITALIVDDEADSRLLVSRILEEHGARVICASSAAEALELVQRGEIPDGKSALGLLYSAGFKTG